MVFDDLIETLRELSEEMALDNDFPDMQELDFN